MHYKQVAILDYIRQQDGRIPTYREIQEKLKIRGLSVVKYHIGVLIRDGFLKVSPRKVELIER